MTTTRLLSRAAIAATLIFSASACSSHRAAPAPDSDRLVEANTENMLSHARAMDALNGEWDIVKANGLDLTSKAEADNDQTPTLTFNLRQDGGGSIYCNTGCNYINADAQFVATDGSLKLDHILSTMKVCDDMDAETAINAALGRTASLRIEHFDGIYYLYLLDTAGEKVLTARRWDNSRLQGAWELVRLGDENVQVADVQIVFDTDQGRIHANTGCNVINGLLRTLPDRVGGLEITGLASTRRGCPEAVADLERRLLVALESVTAAKMSTDGETATLLDASSQPVARLHRLILIK